MSALKKSDPVIIVAGSPMRGSNKQITVPKLTVGRVSADYGKAARKGLMVWSATASDFRKLYLHEFCEVGEASWNHAFAIGVERYDGYGTEVLARVIPIYVRREIDLRGAGIADIVFAALEAGEALLDGKTVCYGELLRAMKSVATSGGA